MSAIRPPLPYFGGKITLGPTIAGLLPAHVHYVEPFCGSLAVLLAKPVSTMETVNDLDEVLVTFWRVLRERPDELIRACALTPHSRVEYNAAVALAASVVLSGYPSDLYDRELYPDWHRVEFAAGTGQGGVWANRTEVLWANRPIEHHLFSEASV